MKTKERSVVAPAATENVVPHETPDDAELMERITTFLHQRNETPLRQLQVDVCDGRVTIAGVVQSFYQKQMAGHCCQRVAGVRHVVNNVTVEQ